MKAKLRLGKQKMSLACQRTFCPPRHQMFSNRHARPRLDLSKWALARGVVAEFETWTIWQNIKHQHFWRRLDFQVATIVRWGHLVPLGSGLRPTAPACASSKLSEARSVASPCLWIGPGALNSAVSIDAVRQNALWPAQLG